MYIIYAGMCSWKVSSSFGVTSYTDLDKSDNPALGEITTWISNTYGPGSVKTGLNDKFFDFYFFILSERATSPML